MAGKWYSEEDFEKDFWSMAEIKTGVRPSLQKQPSSTNSTPRKNIIKSIYFDPELVAPGVDSDKEDEEEIIYRVSSRGRQLNLSLRRPGGKLSDSELYKETQNAIREVAGLGYSNELIEHAFKNRDDEDEEKEEEKEKDIYSHFQLSTNKSGVSTSSTGSPVIHDENNEKIVTNEDFPPLKSRCN